MTTVIARGKRKDGALLRVQHRGNLFDTIINTTGIASGWRYIEKGVSKTRALERLAIEVEAPQVIELNAKFFHKYWRDTDKTPMVYEVTAIRGGWIYIKTEGENKAKEKVGYEDFHKVYGGDAVK